MSERQAKLAIICPECGRVLNPEKGDQHIFCAQCGAKIAVSIEIYERIDHAEIERAHAERDIRMRELDLEERKHDDAQKETPLNYIRTIGSIVNETRKTQEINWDNLSKRDKRKLEKKRIKEEEKRKELRSSFIFVIILFIALFIFIKLKF